MDKKKAILKKYTGEGGPLLDKIAGGIKSTVKGIGDGYNRLKNNVESGITNRIVKFVGNTPAGDQLKGGLEAQKQGVLKNAVKSIAMPKLKDSMPLPKMRPATPVESKAIPDQISKFRRKVMPIQMPKLKDSMPANFKRSITPISPKVAPQLPNKKSY